MAKDLRRPGANPINVMLGVEETPVLMVRLSDVVVVAGRNPRTMLLSEAERATLFGRAALEDLISGMTRKLEDGSQMGVLQPLLVRPLSDETYELVAGERRYHAASFAGLSEIPVQLRDLTDTEALEAAIIENGQREDPDLVSQTFAGFALMRARTHLSTEDLVLYLNNVRLRRTEDVHGLDQALRQLFGTGISTWSQQRAGILKLTRDELAALQQRRLEAKALFPLNRLGSHQGRGTLLKELLALDERPSSKEVSRRVDLLLDTRMQPAALMVQATRALLPRLGKLRPDQVKRVQKLLDQIVKIADEG